MPVPLRVIQETAGGEKLVECTECGKCCTYVAMEIKPPTRLDRATDVLWYLYHENISVYVDGEGEWCVQFDTRCRNLGDDLLCRIYEQRPHVCREFDNTECEMNSPGVETFTFSHPREFLDWLAPRHPRIYKRLLDGFVPAELRKGLPVPPLPRSTRSPKRA